MDLGEPIEIIEIEPAEQPALPATEPQTEPEKVPA